MASKTLCVCVIAMQFALIGALDAQQVCEDPERAALQILEAMNNKLSGEVESKAFAEAGERCCNKLKDATAAARDLARSKGRLHAFGDGAAQVATTGNLKSTCARVVLMEVVVELQSPAVDDETSRKASAEKLQPETRVPPPPTIPGPASRDKLPGPAPLTIPAAPPILADPAPPTVPVPPLATQVDSALLSSDSPSVTLESVTQLKPNNEVPVSKPQIEKSAPSHRSVPPSLGPAPGLTQASGPIP